MRPSSILALLTVLCLSTSAFAQTPAPGGIRFPRLGVDLEDMHDDHQFGDGTNDTCELGDIQACFSLEYGSCADANPSIAIPACTRQLATQNNRRRPGQLRFDRAVRYALRATAHEKQGNVASALSDYDSAVKADGRLFWIQTNRGYAYFSVGDYEQALDSFDAAVALNPDSAPVLIDRALLSAAAPDEELRDAPQALADARRANVRR